VVNLRGASQLAGITPRMVRIGWGAGFGALIAHERGCRALTGDIRMEINCGLGLRKHEPYYPE
jgi:hypothetical protein